MARLTATVLLLAVASSGIGAQEESQPPADDASLPGGEGQATPVEDAGESDLTLPPRIDLVAAQSAPGDVRLEPAEEGREDALDVVVTAGNTEFRLPDLGTSLRNDEEEVDPNQRMEVSFLYLYDPDNIDPAEEAFETNEDLRRVGFLRVFELRFGKRNRDQ